MDEENRDIGLINHNIGDGAAIAPVADSSFHPGIVWKAMGFTWRFPDWHGAWLRSEEKKFLTFRKVDAGQPDDVLAKRTLDELRGLVLSVINCGRLNRPDITENVSVIKKVAHAVQAISGTNRRSLRIHDRISMIPSLSGLLDHHCVICSFFHAFRHFVLFRELDAYHETSNEWELSLTEGGGTALLALLRRIECLGAEKGIGTIRAEELKRFPAFVSGLMKIAGQGEENVGTAAVTPIQQVMTVPKNEDSSGDSLTVNVAVFNPVNVTQHQEAIAISDAVAVNSNCNQNNVQLEQASKEAVAPAPVNTATDNNEHSADEKPEAEPIASGGRSKFQTRQSLQYVVLCILCDLHKSDREASLTAQELAVEVNKRKGYDVDKEDCHKAINDLKIVFSREQPDWEITTGNYRLIAPRYGRADKLKSKFSKMK